MTAKYVVITEEQAEQFQACGIPVDVQYVVNIENLTALKPAAKGAAMPKATAEVRNLEYPNTMHFRWTGLTFRGTKGTQHELAYKYLAEHFIGSAAGYTQTRRQLNEYLSKRFAEHKLVFNSSVFTHLCRQKYMEPVPNK